MLGGDDIVLAAWDMAPQEALATATRQVIREWPTAVLQDGGTSRRFAQFREVPFNRIRELMLYRDEAAFRSWRDEGAVPANAHSMVHLIADPGELTLVVDDHTEPFTARLIASIRGLLDSGLNRRELQEAA